MTHFEILAFLNLLISKFGLFTFSGLGNPASFSLTECKSKDGHFETKAKTSIFFHSKRKKGNYKKWTSLFFDVLQVTITKICVEIECASTLSSDLLKTWRTYTLDVFILLLCFDSSGTLYLYYIFLWFRYSTDKNRIVSNFQVFYGLKYRIKIHKTTKSNF